MTLWTHSNSQFIGFDKQPAETIVRFFATGTREPVTVYKDMDCTSPHPSPVRSDAAGRLPVVHFKPATTKIRAEVTTGDFKVKIIDGIDPGRPDAATAAGAAPVLTSKSVADAAVTIKPEDFGRFLAVSTTSGVTKPAVLPRASTVPDGAILGVESNGAGSVVLRPAGSDLVDGGRTVIVGPGQTALVRCTGSAFKTFASGPERRRTWIVKTRKAVSPPAGGATAGDVYLAPENATGWTPDRLHIADGIGGFTSVTPEVGDRATVADETATAGTGTAAITVPVGLAYTGSGWVADTAFAQARAEDAAAAKIAPVVARVATLEAARTSTSSSIVIRNQVASGTNSLTAQGGTQPTANSWTRNALDTVSGSMTGVALTGNTFTLPKGKYDVRARRKAKGQISALVGLRNTSGTIHLKGMSVVADANQNVVAALDAPLEVTSATDTFELVFLLHGTVGALSLGDAAAIPGEAEVYAEVGITART